MPPSTSLSPTASYYSIDDFSCSFDRTLLRSSLIADNKEKSLPPSARECLTGLIQQVEHEQLRQMLKSELKRLLTDQERIVTMLQQRTKQIEQENEQLKGACAEHQCRYEKAVREMQFFKKKCDYITKQQHAPTLTQSLSMSTANDHPRPRSRQRSQSTISETFSEIASSLPPPPPPTHTAPPPPPTQPSHQPQPLPPTPGSITSQHQLSHPSPPLPRPSSSANGYPLTPTSPRLSSASAEEAYDSLQPLPTSGTMRSRSSSTSTSNSLMQQSHQHHLSFQMQQPYWHAPAALPSVSSVMSSYSATGTSTMSLADNPSRQLPQHPVRHAGTTSIYSVGSDMSFPNSISNASEMHRQQQQHYIKQQNGPGYAPLPPSSSSASTLSSQRRVDPLMYGGSDGLWDTICKGQGSDATVEKIVSNFLRRGGSPNTAKQSPSYQGVRCGYGMVHALIVTKASGALDLLLQQGANPNAMTMSDAEEDKCHIPIDQQDHKGEQPIHWAARAGRLEVVALLVERFNANYNAYLPKRVPTPIEIAKSNGHKRLVDYLKGLGALTTKKLDKSRKEEEKKSKSSRLENALHRNGLFQDDDDEPF
ncbi:hypothetical protein BX666DRAFT_1874824 [Dichotomocladium elegans]|nr:hypothetical protein BX666DRAFT_1874824 [Dichotomocladium elegans]